MCRARSPCYHPIKTVGTWPVASWDIISSEYGTLTAKSLTVSEQKKYDKCFKFLTLQIFSVCIERTQKHTGCLANCHFHLFLWPNHKWEMSDTVHLGKILPLFHLIQCLCTPEVKTKKLDSEKGANHWHHYSQLWVFIPHKACHWTFLDCWEDRSIAQGFWSQRLEWTAQDLCICSFYLGGSTGMGIAL